MNPKSFSSIKTKTLFKSLMKKNFNFVNQWSQNSLALKMSKYDPTKEDVMEVLEHLDEDKSGKIDFNEFKVLIRDVLEAMLEE